MTDNKPNLVSEKLLSRDLKSIKVAPSVHKSIKIESAQTGVEISELVAKAWEAYSSPATGHMEAPVRSKLPREHQVLIGKLSRILASGDEQAINAVAQNIVLSFDRLKPGPSAKKRRG